MPNIPPPTAPIMAVGLSHFLFLLQKVSLGGLSVPPSLLFVRSVVVGVTGLFTNALSEAEALFAAAFAAASSSGVVLKSSDALSSFLGKMLPAFFTRAAIIPMMTEAALTV